MSNACNTPRVRQLLDELSGTCEISNRLKQARAICHVLSMHSEADMDIRHAAWAASDLLAQAEDLLENIEHAAIAGAADEVGTTPGPRRNQGSAA